MYILPISTTVQRVNKLSKYILRVIVWHGIAVINIKLLMPVPPFPQGCIAVNYWYDMEFDTKYNYFNLLANLKHVESLQ